jgi:tetratricopeptide (TPR) repeat protein
MSEFIHPYAKADFSSEASVSFTAAGWAAFCQAKLPDAESHTCQAIQMDSNFENAEAFYQLAKIQMHTDRPSEAIPNLQKAIELVQDAPLGLTGFGQCASGFSLSALARQICRPANQVFRKSGRKP